MKIAFLFAGQGSQYVGMGESLYKNNARAKEIFDVADSIENITDICFKGNEEDLKKTINAQRTLFCSDLASSVALVDMGIKPSCVCGFSLGEIPALAFSNAISLEDAYKLVVKRSSVMNDASEKITGEMYAIMGLLPNVVDELCKQYNNIWAVNFNSDKQTVVACLAEEVPAFLEKVKGQGGKAIKLKVSGPFHSPLMNEAASIFEDYLKNVKFKSPDLDVYSNVTALPYNEDIFNTLKLQMNHPVKFCDTIKNMIASGVDTFIEVGAGKVLSGLVKKINDSVAVYNVDTYEDLLNVKEQLANKE